MATYKKRGQKKSLATIPVKEIESESTTAEVFQTLDTSASKTEQLVSKYQKFILIAIVLVTMSVLSYLGYKTYIYEPKKLEAVGELSQAQYYFELAVNSQNSDSLYLRALNGGEGKFGFLDIIENYEGTPAGMLANYSAGMSYLNLKDYVNAIDYLDKFKSDDVMLSALAKGAIGDAFAQIGQPEDAYDYYVEAFEISDNLFSAPKYLYKAGMLGFNLGNINNALEYFKRIKAEFPNSKESKLVDVQIGRLESQK